MPSEDEIRRQQTVSPAMQSLLARFPKIDCNPATIRRRLAERFQEYTETPPEPDKDYPYQKDTAP